MGKNELGNLLFLMGELLTFSFLSCELGNSLGHLSIKIMFNNLGILTQEFPLKLGTRESGKSLGTFVLVYP